MKDYCFKLYLFAVCKSHAPILSPLCQPLILPEKKKKNFKHDPTNYVNCVCILTIFSIHLKIEDYTYIKFEKSAQIMCTIEFTFLQ